MSLRQMTQEKRAGRHRKVMPFEQSAEAMVQELRQAARKKSRSTQHVLGYGEFFRSRAQCEVAAT